MRPCVHFVGSRCAELWYIHVEFRMCMLTSIYEASFKLSRSGPTSKKGDFIIIFKTNITCTKIRTYVQKYVQKYGGYHDTNDRPDTQIQVQNIYILCMRGFLYAHSTLWLETSHRYSRTRGAKRYEKLHICTQRRDFLGIWRLHVYMRVYIMHIYII